MGCFRIITASILAICCAAPAARAQCRVCDEVISLNSDYAHCFSQNFDQMLSAISNSPQGRIRIDLAQCGQGAQDNDRGGLLVMPSLTGQSRPPKSVYILDAAYLQCLNRLLADFEGPLDPQAEFDLFEQCQ